MALRKARDHAAELRKEVLLRKQIAQRKQKALKDPKTLTFNFGVNLENRASDGMFVYNCSRLIRMYQRIGPQQDSGMTCRGVVGIVNVPYLVLGKNFFTDKTDKTYFWTLFDRNSIVLQTTGTDFFWWQ